MTHRSSGCSMTQTQPHYSSGAQRRKLLFHNILDHHDCALARNAVNEGEIIDVLFQLHVGSFVGYATRRRSAVIARMWRSLVCWINAFFVPDSVRARARLRERPLTSVLVSRRCLTDA